MTTRWLGFLALASMALPASAQNTWYVDVNGIPPGTGTAANPFTTIQQSVENLALAWGDTVLVAPGVYAEVLNFPLKNVHVRSAAGAALTWIEPNASASHVGSIVDLGSNNTLDGFTVSGAKVASSIGVSSTSSTIRNCVLVGHAQNPASPMFTGAGIFSEYDTWLEGSTVSGNVMGFVLGHTAAVYSRDSIIQGNSQWDLDPITFSTISTFDYSLVGGPTVPPGTGNLAGDPLFWIPAERDYRLRPASPCIDAGDPTSAPDPDGSRRDIGAYAYDPAYAPGPVVFCTAKTNSQGCVPAIGSSGHATATGSAPFLVTASNVLPKKGGLLFYGPGKRSQPLPFQGAFHCIQLPTKRVAHQIAGGTTPCTGTFSFDFGAYLAAGSHPLLFPGALIACQWWSRDPQDPSGWGTGLTDGLFFGVAP